MRSLRRHIIVDFVRGTKAFLNLEAGITRGAAPVPYWKSDMLADRRSSGGVAAGNFVWIFGTGRTGSTWLAAMMEEPEKHHVWFEPRVGAIFDARRFDRYGGKHFILSDQYKETWLGSIRNFIFDGADARFPEAADGYLFVKEPGGSEGAQLIVEAMPESRMVLLIRDPRDVVASWLDAAREGGWQNERTAAKGRATDPLADKDPDAFVKRHAQAYLRNVGNAKSAYDTHKGRKALVRYEELRADTSGTMRRMYEALEIPLAEKELRQAVEKHSWENISPDKKGEGKFYRKATPGGWKNDLTPRQVRLVERITAPLLEEFYPA